MILPMPTPGRTGAPVGTSDAHWPAEALLSIPGRYTTNMAPRLFVQKLILTHKNKSCQEIAVPP